MHFHCTFTVQNHTQTSSEQKLQIDGLTSENLEVAAIVQALKNEISKSQTEFQK